MEQIILEPEVAPVYDETGAMTNATEYASSPWRWTYAGTPSAWLASRGAAVADALANHPDVPFG